MFSYCAYVLIGNDKIGKTSFQKYLIEYLCEIQYKKLPRNLRSDISHGKMIREIKTLFTMNRSYQEQLDKVKTVSSFFSDHFYSGDICILSSHADGNSESDLIDFVKELKSRAYNVAAVFFSNDFGNDAQKISLLDWDERLWIENPPIEISSEEDESKIQAHLKLKAIEFADMLIVRTSYQ